MTAPTVVSSGPVTDWLLQLLRTALGRPVDRGQAPAGASLCDGYLVVHLLPGGGPTFGPALSTPDDSAVLVFQVDSVGERCDQVERISDAVRATLLGRTADGAFLHPSPADGPVEVIDRRTDTDGPGATYTAVGEPPNRVWTASERFSLPTQTRGATP